MQAEDTDLSNGNTLLDRATWGLDAAENWLSDTRAATSLMETAANDSFKAQDTRPRSHRGRRPDRR